MSSADARHGRGQDTFSIAGGCVWSSTRDRDGHEPFGKASERQCF